MNNSTMDRINQSLRTAAVKRNAKTALFLGVAASGAIVSTTALAVTAFGSLAGLYFWGHFQKK